MKKAYYIIGMDIFRAQICLDGHIFDIREAAQNYATSIQKTGHITSNHEFYTITDTLVGRERYITLSLEKCCHWRDEQFGCNVKEEQFGYIFDARQLLEQGALLGIQQISKDYERMTHEIIQKVGATLPSYEAERDPGLPALMPELMTALEEKDLDAPGYQQVIADVQYQLRAINAQKLLQGPPAVAYLDNTLEDGSCQILVWQQLAVAQAIGTVWDGEETRAQAEK